MRIQSLLLVLLALILCFAVPASAQTSVGLSLYGAFSGATSGNGTQQSPSNSAGGLIELRHISNPILGVEVTYSYNRANQTYSLSAACPTTGCTNVSPATVKANAHELTLDWIPSVPIGNLRPFGVLGLGLLVDSPAGGDNTSGTSRKPVYVYGAGLDWGLLPHLGLRFQYRGNLYKAPDLTSLYRSTGAFMRTSQPMIGAYFSF